MTRQAAVTYNAAMTVGAHDSAIYLDHAATTPLLPAAAEAMQETALRYGANPASQHGPGRAARRAIEQARDSIAQLVGARVGPQRPDRVVFTSGGTEANNLALTGLGPTRGILVVSAAEHPSIAAAAAVQRRRGRLVETLPLDRSGVVQIGRLEELLGGGEVGLVSVQLGSNETGVVQPIRELAAMCAQAGVPLHTDAVQAVGKTNVDFCQLQATALTVAAHKFHGPLGIGALVVRSEADLHPLLVGGHQQGGLRAGTESVALASGMFAALQAWSDEAAARHARMLSLRTGLEQTLLAGDADAVVVGAQSNRLPHIANISFRGLDRQALVMSLDLAGVACSTGSACASGSSEPSETLTAMGLPDDVIRGSVRLSVGATTTPAEIDLAARRILSAVKHLRDCASS